jgi:hypothetical protein
MQGFWKGGLIEASLTGIFLPPHPVAFFSSSPQY